ncbi:MAG: GIY-YIG nuclease family protein, partial [Patescibacteria group bacterium]
MHFVYIIQSLRFPRQYIGSTANVDMRLIKHNSGSVRSTKTYRPWKLVKTESFNT